MSSGTSDTVYSAIANLDAHDKSIPPDRSKENIAAGLLSILTDGGHTYETLVKGCLVLLLCRTASSKVTGVSNDKFRYPTNDKNSDPGVKLNNC